MGGKAETRMACPKCKTERYMLSEEWRKMCPKCIQFFVPTQFAPGEGTGPIDDATGEHK